MKSSLIAIHKETSARRIGSAVAKLTNEDGRSGHNDIRIGLHSSRRNAMQRRRSLDKDNVSGVCPDCGIPGTQLGPYKNGRAR